MSDDVFDLRQFPVHLGLGASVTRLPAFDGTNEWYQRYGQDVAFTDDVAVDAMDDAVVGVHFDLASDPLVVVKGIGVAADAVAFVE